MEPDNAGRSGLLQRLPVLMSVGLSALLLLGSLAAGVAWLGQGVAGDKGHVAQAKSVKNLRVLVLGDSLAGSLGAGLSDGLKAKGDVVFNGGTPGCSLASNDLASDFRFLVPPRKPCVPGKPDALLNTWRRWIEGFHPDLVLYLSRGDLTDEKINGSWVHLGDQAFDRWYGSRLHQALALFASYGLPAQLMLPSQAESGSRLGVTITEEDPRRRVHMKAMMLAAVHQRAFAKQSFSVLDLAKILSPASLAKAKTNTSAIFCPDGAHYTVTPGMMVAKQEQKDWAQILATSALKQSRAKQSRAKQSRAKQVWKKPGFVLDSPMPPTHPAWWVKLQCGSASMDTPAN